MRGPEPGPTPQHLPGPGGHVAVRIDARTLCDWYGFHHSFARAMGFPDFYGRNMDAWIDCMTSLDALDDGLTAVHVPPGGMLTLVLENHAALRAAAPDIDQALADCTAFVNWRRLVAGEAPVLSLCYDSRGSIQQERPDHDL